MQSLAHPSTPALSALSRWGRGRLRMKTRAYISTAAATDPAPTDAPVPAKVPSIFSSSKRSTPRCPPWLLKARVKGRSNLEKAFTLEEVYDAEYSNILIATPRLSPAQAALGIDAPQKVVIKYFKKDKLLPRPDLQQKLRQEYEIHSALSDHPNIIPMYLGLEDDASVGLFMEYAGESDAYSYLSAKQRLSLREDDARVLMRDVLTALQHMHDKGYVHRDIKSENVFRSECGAWKLGDFGSALRLGDTRTLERQVLKLEGTFSFAAPEYVRIWKGFQRSQLVEATSFKLDSWSSGALAYDVLCGRAPFALHDKISRDEEGENIIKSEPDFPSGLSYDAVSFMRQALEKDPQKRPSVRQLLAHDWLRPREAPAPAVQKRRSRSSSSVGGSSSGGAGSSSGGVGSGEGAA